MKQVRIYRLQDWKETQDIKLPYVIVGEPCERLLKLYENGYLVLVELCHLQGLSEEETAEALSKEAAVLQYQYVCIDAKELPQVYFQRMWYRFLGEPVIIGETERLLIRESIVEDAKAFLELYRDEACKRYLEKPSVSEETIKGYETYIRQYQEGQYAFYEYGMWTVVEKSSGSVAGRMGLEHLHVPAGIALKRITLSSKGTVLSRESLPASLQETEGVSMGYALLPAFRGEGYAVEACREILRYCVEGAYAQSVYLRIDEGNEASQRVYEKL